jgi:hypothetical protein
MPNWRLYAQQPTIAGWVSLQPLALDSSPWLRLRGFWRLRRILVGRTCPHIQSGRTPDEYRQLATEWILKEDRALSSLVNPYLVRRHIRWMGNDPAYVAAVART